MEATGGTELTAELVVDGAVPREPVISPDGRTVAYVVTTVGMRAEHPVGALWTATADGSSPPLRLTDGTAAVSAPRWAADSASLFFLSDTDRHGSPQLHRIRPDGGQVSTLTVWRGGIGAHLPLADARTVAVVAADEPTEEDERRRAERDDALVWGERVHHGRLRLLDLDTGRFGPAVAGLDGRHVAELAQRPDGGPLAVLTWPAPDIDPVAFECRLHVVDPLTGEVRHLGRTELGAFSPTWWRAGDGWHLAYVAAPGPVSGFAVFDLRVPETGAAGEHRNLTAGTPACPSGLAQVADAPPLALFATGLDTAIHRLDPRELRFEPVSQVRGLLESLTASRSGEVVAALASTSYEPVDVHVGPPAGRLVRRSDTRPELRAVRWGSQRRLSYRARDGLDLDGLLVLPVGRAREDGPFPLVTVVHGGPYGRHADRLMLGWHPSGQWLAAGGYAVFLPNPRGSAGRGHDFAAAVAGAVGQGEFADVLRGIDVLVAEGVADPDRLGIAGWSHGGFMTAWAIGQTSRFRAGLMGAGISHWGMLVGTGEEGVLEGGLGGSTGWEGPGPHRHDRRSPVSYASKVRTPVLIVHGQDDTNVPVGQATYFHRALRAHGAHHEFVVYPREGHLIRERNHQLDLLRRTREWFDRWLGAPPR